MRRSFVAGAMGGVVAVALLAVLGAALMRRFMPRMMARMMAGGACSDEMRACMEHCGCSKPAEE